MKKKLLSILAGSAMLLSSFAGAAHAEEAAADIPEAVYYYSFDEADGVEGLQPTSQTLGGDPILAPVENDIVFVDGVKGQALYLDGTSGVKLTDVNGVGDVYTISYWMYAKRYANYMPTVQFGPDVHGDATGGQHYLNITKAEWSSEGGTFPSIWSYDQLDDAKWPNWDAEGGVLRGMNEWVNIALVVDPAETTVDGSLINAKLYIDGERWHEFDKDENEIEYPVVFGTMEPSDNFDFLLGVNYWDAIYKGAFDELYIFDTALTDEQIAALYEKGDPTVKFVEPEREIVVKENADALSQIGSTDLAGGFWTDWSEAYEIKDGETKEITLTNYSNGGQLWNNYVIVFTNEYSEDGQDPNTASDEHVEYAAVRADAYGWLNGDGGQAIPEDKFSWTWDNWNTWRDKTMTEAKVVIKINRSESLLTIDTEITDYLGTVYTSKAEVETALTAEDPCFFLFTNEGCYNEILSITDAIVVEADENAIDSVGKTDYSNGWWTDWSTPVEVADGATVTYNFKNYSDGVNNWDNYVLVFTNQATEPHTDPNLGEGHVEYAAVRADAYGWGGEYTPTYETSWGDDWATWLDAMKAADVTLTITRNGGEIVADAVIVDRNGNELTNKTTFTSALTAEDPCYVMITCEECFIDILSVE